MHIHRKTGYKSGTECSSYQQSLVWSNTVNPFASVNHLTRMFARPFLSH
nr:MAG TPA: hypothetical protein [Caudoviricetes sp.]